MILSWLQTPGRYHPFRGQDRTSKAITTQSTRALAIPRPMIQPQVADSGNSDIAASGSVLSRIIAYTGRRMLDRRRLVIQSWATRV